MSEKKKRKRKQGKTRKKGWWSEVIFWAWIKTEHGLEAYGCSLGVA